MTFDSKLFAFGGTRSTLRRDHLLHTPDAFVRTPLQGLRNGLAILHASPAMGAGFSMWTAELEAGGELSESGSQRFFYVLSGELSLSEASLSEADSRPAHALQASSYAFLPEGSTYRLRAQTPARVVVLEKHFEPLAIEHSNALAVEGERDTPWFLVGREQDVPATALNGDADLQVRSLLPAFPAFDLACNIMTYAPGAALSQVEVHIMEHGLFMLEGGGIYRLGDSWYPVQAGDFIWMGPCCPQWFGALGKTPAKYLIYKDWNRYALR